MALLILLCSCGGGGSPQAPALQPGYTTERLDGIVAQFADDFGIEVKTKVVFVHSFSSAPVAQEIGMCLEGADRAEIVDYLQDSDVLPLTVYHELGHCALHVGHDTREDDIMSPNIKTDVRDNFDSYVRQMVYNFENGLYPKSFLTGG